MGMYGNWLRLPAADLTRAINDLDWAYHQARTAMESEDDRWLGTDKTWHALDFLLHRYGLGVPIVFGEARLVDANETGSVSLADADWGSGPAGYLTPESVATAAARLAGLTEAALIRGVDPAELENAGIYPHVWEDSEDELEWAVHRLADVRRFFTDAAAAGDAVICWLD